MNPRLNIDTDSLSAADGLGPIDRDDGVIVPILVIFAFAMIYVSGKLFENRF